MEGRKNHLTAETQQVHKRGHLFQAHFPPATAWQHQALAKVIVTPQRSLLLNSTLPPISNKGSRAYRKKVYYFPSSSYTFLYKRQRGTCKHSIRYSHSTHLQTPALVAYIRHKGKETLSTTYEGIGRPILSYLHLFNTHNLVQIIRACYYHPKPSSQDVFFSS